MIAPLLVAVALSASPSLAKLATAGGGTVTVSAKQFRYNIPKRLLEYSGDPVRFTRGDSVLTCKRLGAFLDEGGEVTRATCETDVRFERGDKVLTCEKATYEAAAAKLTCEGKPTFKIGAITGEGTLLVYDLEKDEVTGELITGTMPSDEADKLTEEARQRHKAKGAKP